MLYSKVELKEILKKAKEKECVLGSDYDLEKLIMSMVENLGDVDLELRDELIFDVFSCMALNDKLSDELLKKVFNVLLEQKFLFVGIEEKESDFVFKRSFTNLFFAVIVYKHRENKFLSNNDIEILIKNIFEYMKKEKDYRGYVQEKGWAHSIAHLADVVDELACCEETKENDYIQFLELLKNLIEINDYVYINGEDERITTAVLSIFNNLNEAFLKEWISSFDKFKKIGRHPEDMNIKVNIKNFLRSLYFRILREHKFFNLIEDVEKTLEIIN